MCRYIVYTIIDVYIIVQVPLPLDPTVMLEGIVPASCSVFKSAMAPIRLTFRVRGTRCSAGMGHTEML